MLSRMSQGFAGRYESRDVCTRIEKLNNVVECGRWNVMNSIEEQEKCLGRDHGLQALGRVNYLLRIRPKGRNDRCGDVACGFSRRVRSSIYGPRNVGQRDKEDS